MKTMLNYLLFAISGVLLAIALAGPGSGCGPMDGSDFTTTNELSEACGYNDACGEIPVGFQNGDQLICADGYAKYACYVDWNYEECSITCNRIEIDPSFGGTTGNLEFFQKYCTPRTKF